MALAALLNDRTLDLYKGGRFLFRNKKADLELKGPISSILSENDGVRIFLAESSTVRSEGRSRLATGNELVWPIFESAAILVEEIRHGLEIEWKGQGLYARLERKL